MDNWVSLSSELNRLVWDKLYEHFNFKPSVHSGDWPSFSLPSLTLHTTSEDEITRRIKGDIEKCIQ